MVLRGTTALTKPVAVGDQVNTWGPALNAVASEFDVIASGEWVPVANYAGGQIAQIGSFDSIAFDEAAT